MGRYLDIAKRVPGGVGKLSPIGRESDAGVQRCNQYWHRATEALRRIARLRHLGGALRRLEAQDPVRHRWLLGPLRDHLDHLWDAQVPVNEFQDALDRWVSAHEDAVRRYHASIGFLEEERR